MNNTFKGSIYTDLIWLFIGVFGSIYYYAKDTTIIFLVFLFLTFLYVRKLILRFMKRE